MWTIIIVINIAILIEILNCFTQYSSKKNITPKTKIDLTDQTYNLTLGQINNLIDARLKSMLEKQNDMFKQLEQNRCTLESRIENLVHTEKGDTSIPYQITTSTKNHNIQIPSDVTNASNIHMPCSFYNEFEPDSQKNKAASVLTSTFSVVAAVSLAAVSLEKQLENSEKT